MSNSDSSKRIVQDFIQAVWRDRDLAALPDFWTEDCLNHAMPGPDNRGLVVLRAYHEQFFLAFSAFSDLDIQLVQQVAEDDRVVTHIVTGGTHSGPFLDIPPTGKNVTLAAIRIDRIQDGKIAEHWSVSDTAGLVRQLQS